jgi:glucose-6-phosphate dehydrogenase assembly protein OpcA
VIGVEPARIGDLSKIEGLIAQQRGSDATVRAITLTLVILAPDRDRREQAVAMLSEVGGSHPLRALVLTPDRDGPRAAVSLACWTGGDREVCSEQVVIEADAKALPSAAASLLAPDLPVFLWWQGGGDGDGLLRRLAGPAVRLIMDGAECGLDAVRAARALGPAVSDLEWGRLQPWREALAGMFDGEDDREALRRASLLEVDGRESQARLLAGWLRSRLGLHIGLEHRPAAALTRAAIRAGGVYAVEAGGEDGIGRAADPRGEEHSVVLSDPPAAALLAAELGRLGADRIFEQALDAA